MNSLKQMFTINQLNNKFNLSDSDKNQMENVYRALSYSFSGPLDTEDFKNLEMEHFTDVRGSSQFFYLTAANGDVASVTEVVPRKGNQKDSLNLLVSMVFTNPQYRKQGLIGKLISWIITYYETGDINSDPSLLISDSIKNPYCKEYIDMIIPQIYRTTKKIHWSLYSIIGDFYKQFGFVGCDNINWLEIKSNEIAKHAEFQINDKSEKFLKYEDLNEYYFNNNYNFPEIIDENLLNCSLEESSHPGFIERIQSYVKTHQDEISNKEFFQNCGFLIKDELNPKFQTLVFICPFFFINRIIVNRVFTSCPDVEMFSKHWERVVQFIYKYAETTWSYLKCLDEVKADDKIIMISDNDFISVGGVINKQQFTDVVVNKYSSWSNKGVGIVLPMIRDWQEHKVKEGKPSSMLAYNGHWSFM